MKDCHLHIRSGERVLLRGENGSGKSTLIRILLGELTPDEGTVRLGGRIAVALQEDPALSVPAASFLEALKQQPDWHEERFVLYLYGFGFPEELLKRPVGELSGGERKKLFLSVTLSRDADLLILDELTNHLDADSRAYLQEILMQRKCTMLICSHDPDLCLPWDQVISMEGGRKNG